MITKPKTVPELRFPGFEGEWNESSLSDAIASLDAGVSVNSEDSPAIEHELGILKTSCVTKGYFDPSENKRVLDPTEISRLKEPVSKNSIVISRMNTPALVGLSGLVPQDEKHLFLPDRLWAAKVASNHSPHWIAQLLASEKVRGQLSDRASGTSGSMKNITKGDVLSLPVVIPTLPEQRKIADFLTAVDGRIGQLSQKKALLEDYKKGVMQQLFTQALRFKDDHGNDFPEWEEKTVEEMFTVTRGKVLAMPETKSLPTSEFRYPVYSSQTKENGLAGYYDKFLFSDAITWTTDGANAGDVKFRRGEFYCTNVCGVLLSDKGYANAFVASILGTVTRQHVSYVGNPKLMNNVMSKISISVPTSIPEQTKIANFLTALDRKIESVSQQITHTQTFKKALLQQMFV